MSVFSLHPCWALNYLRGGVAPILRPFPLMQERFGLFGNFFVNAAV